MNHNIRASPAPLSNSEGLREDTALSCSSAAYEACDKPRRKYTPKSPGFVPHDHSFERQEFQENKKSIEELKDFARTTPPDLCCSQPTMERRSMAGLSRTDSGRRRRVLESITDSHSLSLKPLKRLLYRLDRSATTSALIQHSVPRGSIDIMSKETNGGRRYMKIAVDPKFYGIENPSTYGVNFQDQKTKKKRQQRIGRRPKPQTGPETDVSKISKQDSDLLDNTDNYCKKGKDDYPDLLRGSEIGKPVTGQTNNGYSPSKGIPKPELGPNIQESAAATLAIAQAHARKAGQVSLPPERTEVKPRPHASGYHPNRKKASSKGPQSVPIKFQMRAQRNSLPRTPRTSLDEPGKVEDTSPVVNGKPQASSTISGTDSCVDDVQSEIDPGEIMNARSAEVIHRQGTFGYHGRAANKPPRSGPAPTRALPSLPEGHDGVVMHPSAKLTNLTPTAPASQAATGGLPKTKGPQSPPKGHRYRLSPIKNNLRQETSIPHELEPSPKFTEEFPQPPQSLVPAVPDKSREASPARRNRKVDVSQVVAGLRTESQDLNQNAALFKGDDAHETLDLWNFPSVAGTEPSSEHPVVLPQKLSDPDENDLYIPWQASRVKRVKALKLRDMERLRSRQGSAISPKSLAGNNGVSTNPRSNGEAADHKFSSQSLSLPPVQTTEDLRPLTQSDLSPNKRPSSLSTRNELSPIIVIASQPPCPSKQPDRASPNSSHLNHTISPKAIGVRPPTLQCPVHSTLDPTPPLNRAPSPTTAGRQSSSCLHSQHSYTSLTNHTSYTAELEARIAAMEKKNLLLERAFMAVIDATAGFGSALSGRGSSGCERGSWTQEGGPERLSATSDVLAPSVGKVENMLMEMQAKVGRLG